LGNVIVLGSIVMDVTAVAPRFPAPGETLIGDSVGLYPGGKGANQAVCAARLGANTSLIGCVGADRLGDELLQFLARDLGTAHIRRVSDAPTGVGVIVVAGSENSIVLVPGASDRIAKSDLAGVCFAEGDVLLAQLETAIDVTEEFFARGRAVRATTVLNAAPARSVPKSLWTLADILVVNEMELAQISGRALSFEEPMDSVFEAAQSLIARAGQAVCVTLGERGFAALIGAERLRVPARCVVAVDATGAGDCFVGAMAARLAAGSALAASLGYANIAASLSVERAGAGPSMPARAEVERVMASGDTPATR
jgi:ribokinase